MTVMRRLRAGMDWLQYGAKYSLIALYGPAQQDAATDPLQQLKREHRPNEQVMAYAGVDRRHGPDRRIPVLTEAQVLLAEEITDTENETWAIRVDTRGNVRNIRAESGSLLMLTLPALLFGVGVGGLLDSAVFHQLLQWHLVDARVDGGLELGSVGFIVVALVMLWTRAAHHEHRLWRYAGLSFLGWTLVGYAAYNLFAISLPSLLLDAHHINEMDGDPLSWDIGFLAIMLTVLATGLGLAAQGRPRDVAHDDWVG